jgi:NAD(P)-dependent dehydrogenase (short-subunit alcohol dehydrogenase family)
MSDLAGRVAIVTGGASGIGYAFAQALARAGISVAIGDLRDADAAAGKLRAEGLRAMGMRCDVASAGDWQALTAATVETFGAVHILVNNAALFSTLEPGPFSAITAEEWSRVMEVNTLGPFLGIKAALAPLRRAGTGRVINIASNTVHKGAPGLLHYVSSKGAVIAMTRALARELGRDGITVNAIAPGFTLSEGVMANESYQATFRAAAADARAIPRDQVPADLTGALLFLASPGAGFITGQTLIVDGGNIFC